MKFSFFITALAVTATVSACGKKTDDATDSAESTSNISESVVSEAGSQASSAEGASTPGFLSVNSVNPSDLVDPQDAGRIASGAVSASAVCSFSTARSSCSANADTITWNSCSIGTATLSGGWTETWSGGGTCPTAPSSAGHAVTRTSTSQVLTLASGATLTTDTNAHTAYDGTTIPAGGTVVTSGGGSTRTIVINGIHRVFKGPLGRSWFDHSITSTGLTMNGTRALGTRVISGSSTMYHNLAKYKAVHTFNAVTWATPTCCYPTSGSVSTVLTGTGRNGNVNLAFTTTCGQATFTDTDSTTSTITLTQCN